MGIKDYLLSEKVSRDEIAEVLKNPNVYVGAEFEFYLPNFITKHAKDIEHYEKVDNMQTDYNDYDDALELYDTDPDNNPQPVLPKWAAEMGYEAGEDIPSPDEIFPGNDENRAKLFDTLVKEFLPVKKLPFKNYMVSTDNMEKSANTWIIKPDGSLGLSGVEIVSPVLPLKEFLDVTPKMFEYINNLDKEHNVIDDSCGFHIGMSLKNIKNLGKSLDITKLSVFQDEGYIYKFFETREFNTYARSAFDTIRGALISSNAPELMHKLIDDKKLEKGYPLEHYMAINVEHLESANEYIEFRYIGGADYHKKWDKIRTITAHYAYNLALACDPTFKFKEYHHKVERIMNKIQLFTIVVNMTTMVNDNTLSDNIRNQKNWSALWKSWNALKIYKDAVDADIKGKHTSSARRGFERLLIMLNMKEDELIWDFSKMKLLPKRKENM